MAVWEARAARASRYRRMGAALILTPRVVIAPLGLFAAGPFQDLNPGSAHNASIEAVADAGISKGCADAQHDCPNDLVTASRSRASSPAPPGSAAPRRSRAP